MSAGRYRKKPVVIDAWQVGTENAYAVAEWCAGEVVHGDGYKPSEWVPVGVDIHTLEGVMRANVADWVIKGVQGEFYPCKPAIFDATYEPELVMGEAEMSDK